MSALTVPNDRKSRIAKGIDALVKSATKLNDQIQFVATDIVFHAVECGDVSLADRLVQSLGSGVRRDALVAWFCNTGCMKVKIEENVDAKGKKVKTSHFVLNKDRQEKIKAWIGAEGEVAVFGKMRKMPWQDAKKESDPMKPIELTKLLRGLLARAEKAAADPNLANQSDLALLPALKALVPVAAKQTA